MCSSTWTRWSAATSKQASPTSRPSPRSDGSRALSEVQSGVQAMQKITPFLLINGRAEMAMNFYTSVFKNAKVVDVSRSGDSGPLFGATVELDGERFMLLNTGPKAEFSAAVSFYINCETQDEVDDLWDKLVDGGTPLRCGWLKDKFGVH